MAVVKAKSGKEYFYSTKKYSDYEIRKLKFDFVNIPREASDKLKTLSKDFKYGKELKRGKTIEAMAWQYNIIKDTKKAIVWRDGKFEVIEYEKIL
tara:strand:+ start:1802 stop:2086 length:285 start_codon:yes stop_codon:yes gene_type:complete